MIEFLRLIGIVKNQVKEPYNRYIYTMQISLAQYTQKLWWLIPAKSENLRIPGEMVYQGDTMCISHLRVYMINLSILLLVTTLTFTELMNST